MSSHFELPGDAILTYHFWEHSSPHHSCKQPISCNAWVVCCNLPEPAEPSSPTVISLDGYVLFLAPGLVLASQGGGALQNFKKGWRPNIIIFCFDWGLKQNSSWAPSVRSQKLAQGTRNYFLVPVWYTQEEDASIYSIIDSYIHVRNGHYLLDTTREGDGWHRTRLSPSNSSIVAYYIFTSFWGILWLWYEVFAKGSWVKVPTW